MNILIKSQSESEESSSRNDYKLQSLLQKLAIKSLRSAENVMKEELFDTIQAKYEEIVNSDGNIISFIEFLVYHLINQIDKMQQLCSIDVIKEDYETLENAVQKSQAQIRKHIRIEQQLKIYLDSLEQKVEQLQKNLDVQENKYSQLFETMRQIEQQRKILLKKLNRYEEHNKEKIKSQSNYSTINDQFYNQYTAARKSKGSKSKNVIEKFNQRARKLSDKKTGNKKMEFTEGSIQINLSNNIVVSKKNSYDQNLNRNNPISQDSSIRQLTKTVQMKQPIISHHDRRPNRKISKYKTQGPEIGEKKQCRSSSVCN